MAETQIQIPPETLGMRLQRARRFAGLSQRQLAEEMGISEGTVSNYETDATAHPKQIVLREWARVTGVPRDWLIEGLTSQSEVVGWLTLTQAGETVSPFSTVAA